MELQKRLVEVFKWMGLSDAQAHSDVASYPDKAFSGEYRPEHVPEGERTIPNEGIVVDRGDAALYIDCDTTYMECVLLAVAHNMGAETYLDACDMIPALQHWWNGGKYSVWIPADTGGDDATG